MLRDRMDEVLGRIERAATRSGRNPKEINLIGVVKTVPPVVVSEAVALGLEDLGESRVQEAVDKVAHVGRHAARWHLIGHLQKNKAGRAVQLFDRIHSLDSVELAEALTRRAGAAGVRLPVLLEVNVSGEATKHGVAPGDAAGVAERIGGLESLALDGLMTIAPFSDDPEAARPHFAALRELRDAMERTLGVRLPHLSMGMSGDYEVAVEEGSTMVRVGTAIFGARPA